MFGRECNSFSAWCSTSMQRAQTKAKTPGLTSCTRNGAMSGLYAYFRSDRDARRHNRRDGLHRFFGQVDVQQSSSRPVPMGEPELDDDVVMEVSSNSTSDLEAEQPHMFRRSLPPGGSGLTEVPQHRPTEFRVGSFSLPVMTLSRCGPLEHAAETMARSCFEQGMVTWMQLEAIMNAVPEDQNQVETEGAHRAGQSEVVYDRCMGQRPANRPHSTSSLFSKCQSHACLHPTGGGPKLLFQFVHAGAQCMLQAAS